MATAFTPTPEQEKVIAHRGGHFQVIACAGAGKTEAVSRRVSTLIEESVDPAQIIAFTFTERAAASLKTRITRRIADLGEVGRRSLPEGSDPFIQARSRRHEIASATFPGPCLGRNCPTAG